MYKNVLLVRNGCEGCSMETCLGVLLAESLNAKVTAVYATGSFTGQELRKICGADELKWSGAGKVAKEAMAVSEEREAGLAKEALESTEKMCADRRVPCETVHFSSRSPLHSALELAEEKQCDVIVTSIQPHWLTNRCMTSRRATDTRRFPCCFITPRDRWDPWGEPRGMPLSYQRKGASGREKEMRKCIVTFLPTSLLLAFLAMTVLTCGGGGGE